MAVETERVTLRLPVQDLRLLDAFVESGEYMNRSDVIRRAIKDFVRSRAKEVLEGTDASHTLMEAASKNHQLKELQAALKAQQETLNKLMQK